MNLTEEAKEKRATAYAQHCANHPDGCKYDHCDEWAYGFEDGYKIGAALSSQWVRIETEADLPKEKGKIWVTLKDGTVSTFVYSMARHCDYNETQFCLQHFIAWMPYFRPAPLQEEADV